MKKSVLMAMVMATGCGVSQTEGVDGQDALGEDGAELSTVSRTYVTFTRDFRKCASPMCGGWFVTDVNRVNPAPRYVNALDFTASGLDEATVAKALDGSETILRGKLGPSESLRNTRPFLVSDAWRGMPGVNDGAGDTFFRVQAVNIQCFKAPCPSMQTTRLNASNSTLFHRTDVSDAALTRVDQAWLTNRVEEHGALVSAHFVNGALISGSYEKVLKTSQVYVKLPESPGPCPLFKMPACPSGTVRAFARSVDRCENPGACVTPGVCAQYFPTCADGYTLQTWSGGSHACPNFACDPTFSL